MRVLHAACNNVESMQTWSRMFVERLMREILKQNRVTSEKSPEPDI